LGEPSGEGFYAAVEHEFLVQDSDGGHVHRQCTTAREHGGQ
jgi:hypothetical protein